MRGMASLVSRNRDAVGNAPAEEWALPSLVVVESGTAGNRTGFRAERHEFWPNLRGKRYSYFGQQRRIVVGLRWNAI